MPQLQSKSQQPSSGNGILDALMQLAIPNAAADTLKQSQQMDQQTASQQQKIQLNPYQKGVEKFLKQAGETHAAEAVDQGVPVEHIVNQAGLNPPQQGTANPHQVLTNLVNGATQSQPQMQQTLGASALASASQPATGDAKTLQDQAMNIVNPQGNHPLGMLLNLVGNLSGMSAANQAINSVKLSNISQAQEITGTKPVAAPEYLKQAVELAKNGSLQPDQLMTKFEQASQQFITQRDSYARLQSLITDPSPAGDLGLIFSYMKLLDPNSTVREGEQATAENARGIPDTIKNLYGKILSGKKLTEAQRTDFLKRSGGIFKSAEAQQKKTTAEFSRLGRMNGIDPKRFIRDTGLASETEEPKQETAVKEGFTKTPGGNSFKKL